MPAPAPFRRLFSIAWVISRAFSSNRVQAVGAMPWSLMIVVPYMLRRIAFQSDDGHGVVFFGRHRPVVDGLLVVPLMGVTIGLVGYLIATVRLESPLAAPMLLLVAAFLAYGAAGFFGGAGAVGTTIGPETPSGTRYAVMALSQRPGTRYSALYLVRDLIGSLPPGSVLVAVALNERIATRYERLGFTRGENLRVYRVIDGETSLPGAA